MECSSKSCSFAEPRRDNFINLSRKQFPKCPESALGAVGIVRGASRGGKTLNYLKPVNVYEEINIFDKWGMI